MGNPASSLPRYPRKNKSLRRASARAAAAVIESLEGRQLLSVVTAFPVPGADADSWDGSTAHIVAGPDGNYWFTDPTDNAIGKLTPGGNVVMFPLPVHNVPVDDGGGINVPLKGPVATPGTISATASGYDPTVGGVSSGGVITSGGANSGGGSSTAPNATAPDDPSPTDIVVGPNGNLWFTENGVDRIGEITTDGKIIEFQTPSAGSNPLGLTVGADGNLWFAESGSEAIAKITTSGVITEYPLTHLDVSYLDGIATGSDGNVWFIADDDNYDGVVASITPKGKITSFPIDTDPTALAAGPDGNLWVGTDTGQITRVTTAGVATDFTIPDDADVNTIHAGTDGNLWFSLDGNNQLGKITPAGVVSEFELPGTTSDPSNSGVSLGDVIQGSDGLLWFVDSDTPQVGKIDLTNALLASGTDISVSAGTSTTSTFASFVDLGGNTDPSRYTATITLADGSTLSGTIAANSTGGFDVTATHTWTIGYTNVTVTITDTADATRVATASTSVDATAPDAVGTGIAVSATSGQLFSGTVATFTNVDLASIASYSATIDWGDGHTTTGTITANASGGFDITGSNRYADAGTFTVTTSLSPYPYIGFYPGGPISVVPVPGGNSGIAPTTPISSTGAILQPITAVTPVHHPIATVTPVVSSNAASGATANTSSTGASGSGNAIISGGPNIGIGVDPIPGGPIIDPLPPIRFNSGDTATSTATVAAGVMDGTGYSVQASSTTPFNDIVANFTLADPSADLSHFHATVIWNDPGIRNWWFQLSNANSDGVITPDGNGGFTVSTATSFSTSGLFHFVVQISDDRLGTGDSAIVGAAYGQVIVDTPFRWLPVLDANAPTAATGGSNVADASVASDPTLSEKVKVTGVPVTTATGKTFTGNVGILNGVTSSSISNLKGTIHWGDGTTSTATFAPGKNGHVAVKGSHVYTTAGTQSVSVDLSQSLITNGAASPLYPLHLPMIESAAKVKGAHAASHATPIKTGGLAITAIHGVAFTTAVATFPASAPPTGVTQSATISWGDGKHSAGTLDLASGSLTVTGGHTYRKSGKYKVVVKVTQSVAHGSKLKVAHVLADIPTTAIVS